MMAHLGAQTGGDDLFWPQIVRGFGTVLMFPPHQLAALGPEPKEEVASPSGFFNLTRQLGGSIGVALLTTLLDKREAFHRAVLVEKLASSDPHTVDRLTTLTRGMLAQGMSLRGRAGSGARRGRGSSRRQSAVMAFGDTFWATTVLVLCALPLVLLLGKPAKGAPVMAAH